LNLPAGARRRLLPLYHHAVRRSPDLRYLFFEITQRCNLACRHCGSDCQVSSIHEDLPVETALRVAREVASTMDVRRVTGVITGGEPLCHPGVFDLGTGLSELGFRWGMVTNGWLWEADTVARARAAGMHSACVSLDGLRETHDALRGRPGSFERALRTIDLLRSAGGPPVMDVVTCAHPGNLDELHAVHDLLVAHRVPAWRIFTIDPIGRGADPALQLDRDSFQRLVRTVAALRAESPMKVNFGCGGHLGYGTNLAVRDADYVCLAGIRVGGVMVDGAILACPNIDRRLAQGNVREDSFVQAWRERYQPFRDRRWMRQGLCRACREWGQCQGNDMHLWDVDQNQTRLCHHRAYDLGKFAR
jgi:radical SAM protein with 4Fe4S-binding SPASM domain